MVSFWPFKGDDTSAASFERVLKQLSTKITKASAQNDLLRLRQRKYKVLWTIYASFAYIIIAAILVLVTGWDRWGPLEYTVFAGGPPFIYGVRTTLDTYYAYRIANSQTHLTDLNKQRDSSIDKLKAATKYNSTQELLDKYGKKPEQDPAGSQKKGKQGTQGKQQSPIQRTGFAPPPTANIQRGPAPAPIPPLKGGHASIPPQHSSGIPPPGSRPQSSAGLEPGEEFAPNAFSPEDAVPPVRQTSVQYAEGPKWYDRILDVMLGEDETQAKYRIVLICQKCRLVNGQAPPGARSLEDVGRWRCGQCQAWNGVESETAKVLRQMSVSEPDVHPDGHADSSHIDADHHQGGGAHEEKAKSPLVEETDSKE